MCQASRHAATVRKLQADQNTEPKPVGSPPLQTETAELASQLELAETDFVSQRDQLTKGQADSTELRAKAKEADEKQSTLRQSSKEAASAQDVLKADLETERGKGSEAQAEVDGYLGLSGV